MPIKRLKNISVKGKFRIIGTLSILFLLIFALIFLFVKKNIDNRLDFLQKKYVKKNETVYRIHRVLDNFIVSNYLSFEKFETLTKIQNEFYVVNDSIEYYENLYSGYISSIEENQLFEKFKFEYQKFQSTVYEVFNQYKEEEIKYNLVKKYIDDELFQYKKIDAILKKLKSLNDNIYDYQIRELNRLTNNLLLGSLISLLIFLVFMLYLTGTMFSGSLKVPENLKKYLVQFRTKGILEKLPDKDEVSILVDDIKNINELNTNIKKTIDFLIEDQFDFEIKENTNILCTTIKELKIKLENIRDQQELKKLEDERKEWANKGQALFSGILRRYSNDLQKLSDEVLKNMVKYLDAAVGGIFIIQEEDEKHKYLELISAFAYDRKKFFSRRVELGEGLVGTVAVDKSLLFLNQIPEDYLQIEAGLGDAPPNSLLIIPLISDSGLMGVLEIASFKILEQFEIDFAQDISHSIASTIESVKINERTKQLLEESRKQSEELARREKVLQETFEEVAKAHAAAKRNEIELRGILSGVDQTLLRAEYTPEGIFLDSNLVHRRVMGYNIDWMRGKSIFEFIPDEEKKEFSAMWKEIASGKPKQITVKRQNKQTGKTVWLLNNYTPILNEEKQVVKILYLAIDITEQKVAEEETKKLLEETRKKEIELRGILSGIDKTILRAEYLPDGTFIDANDIHTQVLGYRKESMIGKKVFEFIDPDEVEDYKKNIWNKVSRGQALELTVKRTNKATGRDIWLINQYTPIFDDKNNVIKILYLAIDITKQKLVEETAQQLLQQTKEKELELRGILAGIDRTILRAEYTSEGILLDANEIHQEILGYDIEKMRGKSILEFVSDEEKEDFQTFWNEVKSGIARELTVKRENKSTGEDIWLINQYVPIVDEDGKVEKVLYLAIDITEAKKNEELVQDLLKKAEERELELIGILNAIDHSVLRAEYSPEGIFLDANEMHQEVLGYEKSEMIGKSIFEFVSEEEKEEFEEVWNAVISGEFMELTVKRVNLATGEDIWLTNYYNPIFDEQKNVVKVLYLAINVTEHKTLEYFTQDMLEEAQQRELELAEIISAFDEKVYRAIFSADWELIEANEKHTQLFDYDEIEMVGHSIVDILPEDFKNIFDEVREQILEGEKLVKEISYKDLFLEIIFVPIFDQEGNIYKIVNLIFDITKLKKLEQELSGFNAKQAEELKKFEELKQKLSEKFDTDIDKLYDQWLKSFE